MVTHIFTPSPLLQAAKSTAPRALLLAAVLVGLSMPAQAAYRPEQKIVLKGKTKTMLREALSAFNALPDIGRQAIIANRLELYFSEEGDSRYNSWDHCPNSGAKFVCSDGNVRDWRQVKDSIPPVQWNDADRKVYDLGANAVFPSVAKEVTPLIYETAKAVVNSMPPELRDSWLAEEAGLLYTASGAKAYAKGYATTTTDSGKEVKSKKLTSIYDLRFKDAEGEEHQYAKVLADHAQKYERRRKVLYLCIQYTSRKEILDLFADEVSALKRARSKTSEVASASSSASATSGRATQATTTSSSGSSSSTTAMGDRQAPQATKLKTAYVSTASPSIPPASTLDQYPVAMIKKMTPAAREALLAEKLGLCFMEDGSKSVDSNNWVRGGAKYIGSDGKEHDFWTSQREARDTWGKITPYLRTEMQWMDLLPIFSDLVTQMILHNARYHLKAMPDILREAWIAETSGLFYLPGSSHSAYPGSIDRTEMDNGFRRPYKIFSGSPKFRDSQGEEHSWRERDPYWNTWMRRWDILSFCANVVGQDKITDLVPELTATLRKNAVEANKFPFTPLPAILTDTSASDALSKSPAVTTLKSLPKEALEAWLSEIMGMCFMSDHTSSRLNAKELKPEALYIGSDGKEHNVREAKLKSEKALATLESQIGNTSKISLIREFPKQVEALCLAAAKAHLLNQAEFMRETYLAETAGLYHSADGSSSAYLNVIGTMYTDTDFFGLYQRTNANVAMFCDTKGVERTQKEAMPFWKEYRQRWTILNVCVSMIGADKILALFPDTISKLRENNPLANKFPLESPIEPRLYMKNKMTDAGVYLADQPSKVRDAWLAEAMGLCFMKDGSSSCDERNWVKRGAYFIDSNGEECDFWQYQNDFVWMKMGALLPYGKRLVLHDFDDEAEALALAAIKHRLKDFPQLLRDAWLCEIAGLVYLPDSEEDPYRSAANDYHTDNGNPFCAKLTKSEAVFTDTENVQHTMKERQAYWNEYGRRWNTAYVCLKYCRMSKVIIAFGSKIYTLRRNYERATNRKAP